MHAAQTFGSRLYDTVFAGEVGTAYRRSLDAAEREGKGLRLRLRLTGAPDLGDLPWEYLYSEGLGDFLVLSDRRPMVRYPELPVSVRPLLVEAPLRILLLISAPSDYPTLDVEAEEARLRDALAGVIADGRAELMTLERATLSELQRALAARRRPHPALHRTRWVRPRQRRRGTGAGGRAGAGADGVGAKPGDHPP